MGERFLPRGGGGNRRTDQDRSSSAALYSRLDMGDLAPVPGPRRRLGLRSKGRPRLFSFAVASPWTYLAAERVDRGVRGRPLAARGRDPAEPGRRGGRRDAARSSGCRAARTSGSRSSGPEREAYRAGPPTRIAVPRDRARTRGGLRARRRAPGVLRGLRPRRPRSPGAAAAAAGLGPGSGRGRATPGPTAWPRHEGARVAQLGAGGPAGPAARAPSSIAASTASRRRARPRDGAAPGAPSSCDAMLRAPLP